ncbi:hypothetical protein LCGC14_1288540 [marine sediment metagenome]|uniref:Uncharacterized protein n=1 Tax=marine sediment metagenome TaxID=412755 RepID=A0A0F9KUS8_9ZZZZ
MIESEKISKTAQSIKDSNYIIVFSGAGIFTGSGIDDFRSPGGFWGS